MRMWLVNPKLMCHLHLMAEHRELHLFVDKIRIGAKLDGYYNNGMMQDDAIRNRHFCLENEMTERFYKIPERYRNLPPFQHFGRGYVDIERSVITLIFRCKRCRKIMEEYYESTL